MENIKNKHLARRHDAKRHSNTTTTAVPVNNVEQKDYLNSLFSSSSSSPKSIGLVSMDNHNSTITSAPSPLSTTLTSSSDQSPSYSTNYHHQRSSSQKFDPGQSPSYIDIKTPLFNELLTPTSSPSYVPVNHNPSTPVHSFMNASFQGTINDSTSPSSFTKHQYNTTYRY